MTVLLGKMLPRLHASGIEEFDLMGPTRRPLLNSNDASEPGSRHIIASDFAKAVLQWLCTLRKGGGNVIVQPTHIPTSRTDRHNTDDRSRPSVESRPPLFVLAGAFLCYYLRFGYDYAHGDQDDSFRICFTDRIRPVCRRLARTHSSHRIQRTHLFRMACTIHFTIMPVWLAVLILYAVCWLCIAWTVWKIAWYFTADRLVASGRCS